MEKPQTRSQKRNKRRTAARHSRHLYNVGDTVIVESHDRDDYLMEDNNWTYKGFIEKVYTHLGGTYVYYIVRSELPISFESSIMYLDTKIWPASKDNCTFSRKRYGDKFLDIIAYKEGINRENITDRNTREYLDYTSVCQIDERKYTTFLRVFPSSKYRPTLRECLYNFWFVETHSAVGTCSIITDPSIRKTFMTGNTRWDFVYSSDKIDLYNLKVDVGSKKVRDTISSCISPDFQQQPDTQYPFIDGFEEFEYTSSPFSCCEYGKMMVNTPVLMSFELVYDSYDLAVVRINKWRAIPKELYDIYVLVSTTRNNKPQQSGCIFDKYLNCEYKDLPADMKEICSNVMWPRDRIFEVKKQDSSYYSLGEKSYLQEVSSL